MAGHIATQALAHARADVGVREEGGNNQGPQVAAYLASVGLRPGNPWCMAFVFAKLWQAANTLGDDAVADFHRSGFPVTAWCPALYAWARKNELWVFPENARAEQIGPGDLALFWYDVKRRHAHVGFVAGPLERRHVQTIEGNTSPERPTVERDGDGVYLKNRAIWQLGELGGFVRLPF